MLLYYLSNYLKFSRSQNITNAISVKLYFLDQNQKLLKF